MSLANRHSAPSPKGWPVPKAFEVKELIHEDEGGFSAEILVRGESVISTARFGSEDEVKNVLFWAVHVLSETYGEIESRTISLDDHGSRRESAQSSQTALPVSPFVKPRWERSWAELEGEERSERPEKDVIQELVAYEQEYPFDPGELPQA